jgi:predicted secreted protein
LIPTLIQSVENGTKSIKKRQRLTGNERIEKMNKKKIFLVVTIVIILVAIGAGVAIGMGNVKKTSDTLVLKSGKTIEIILEENPSTGFAWSLVTPEDGVVEVLRDYYQEGPAVPGAAGKHVWKIKGLEKGETQLVFQYLRSWEENSTIEEKVFYLKVK